MVRLCSVERLCSVWSVFCSVAASLALWSVGLAAVITCLMPSCLDPGLAWCLPLAWPLTHGGPLRGLWRAATRLVACGRPLRAARGGPLRGGPQTTTWPRRGAATRHRYHIPVQSYFSKPRFSSLARDAEYLLVRLPVRPVDHQAQSLTIALRSPATERGAKAFSPPSLSPSTDTKRFERFEQQDHGRPRHHDRQAWR